MNSVPLLFIGSIVFLALAGAAALAAATMGIKKPGRMLALSTASVLLTVATIQLQYQLYILKPVLFDLATYPGMVSFFDIIVVGFISLAVHEEISKRREERSNPST